MFQGSIDRLTPEGAVGWFYSKSLDVKPNVVAFLHDRFLGSAALNIYRPDLEEVGFGDGYYGFEIKFDEPLSDNLLPFVSIRPEGSTLSIPFTQNALLIDLAASLTSAFPGAGRNRSLLGGLWTDRTDALQILAGRMAVGVCTVELQPRLRELIADGYVTMHEIFGPSGIGEETLSLIEAVNALPHAANRSDDVKKTLFELASVFYEKRIVALLQAIFDDQPVIYGVDIVNEETTFAQVCSFEQFPSPAECLALYVACPDLDAQIEVIRDSHELPEFTLQGRSRWTAAAAEYLPAIAAEAGSSVSSIELKNGDMIVVGPGLMHRIPNTSIAKVVRVLCAPRRITPNRFLTNGGSWTEASHHSGARIRL